MDAVRSGSLVQLDLFEGDAPGPDEVRAGERDLQARYDALAKTHGLPPARVILSGRRATGGVIQYGTREEPHVIRVSSHMSADDRLQNVLHEATQRSATSAGAPRRAIPRGSGPSRARWESSARPRPKRSASAASASATRATRTAARAARPSGRAARRSAGRAFARPASGPAVRRASSSSGARSPRAAGSETARSRRGGARRGRGDPPRRRGARGGTSVAGVLFPDDAERPRLPEEDVREGGCEVEDAARVRGPRRGQEDRRPGRHREGRRARSTTEVSMSSGKKGLGRRPRSRAVKGGRALSTRCRP